MDLSNIKEQIDKDGYATIENFLTDEEVQSLRSAMAGIIDSLDPKEHHSVFRTENQFNNDYFMTSGDKIRFFFEDGAIDKDGQLTVDKSRSVNKVGHALHCLQPAFKKVTFSEKVKNVAKCLGMEDPVVVQSMYIFKPPGIGGKVVPHQDSTFLYTSPHSLRGLWIALEDASLDNGCLWFIPGSHKGENVLNTKAVFEEQDIGDLFLWGAAAKGERLFPAAHTSSQRVCMATRGWSERNTRSQAVTRLSSSALTSSMTAPSSSQYLSRKEQWSRFMGRWFTRVSTTTPTGPAKSTPSTSMTTPAVPMISRTGCSRQRSTPSPTCTPSSRQSSSRQRPTPSPTCTPSSRQSSSRQRPTPSPTCTPSSSSPPVVRGQHLHPHVHPVAGSPPADRGQRLHPHVLPVAAVLQSSEQSVLEENR